MIDNNKMFGLPERYIKNGETIIKLPVISQILDVKLECTKDGVIPNIEIQSKFDDLRSNVLENLIKETKLFKTPPSLTALNAVTPLWGIIEDNNEFKWSPYTHITITDEQKDVCPCIIDLRLSYIEISRSTIYPEFEIIIIEQTTDISEIIGFEDITEIDEIDEIVETKPLKINTEEIRMKKALDKEKIRAAFRKSDYMRLTAISMANIFFDTYDISDTESTFSEWMED